MRLFLAINLPADVRERAVRATAPLRAAAPGVAWVDEARLHLTLKFLGECPESAVAPLAATVGAIAAGHMPFEIAVEGAGAFPNLRKPRVVWLGVAPSTKLELLQHDVEAACDALGYELEGRPFHPHVTLGRVRDDLPRAQLDRLAAVTPSVSFRAAANVGSVELMRSQTLPSGARYDALATAPLRTA